ncbi:helix-turn-helix domain-containing protein [Candidatus Saccharibacteria bacterium]|nr:helix-turn-helix domain-containing protein [Candidatus Saccharibacteria bacterium]
MNQRIGFKQLRITKGLKQDDVARMTQIPQPRLSAIELGKGRPVTERGRAKLAKVYGVTNSDEGDK